MQCQHAVLPQLNNVERAVVCNINDSMQSTEAVVADSAIINSNALRLEDEIENQRRMRDKDLADSLKPLQAIDAELVLASSYLGLPTTGAYSWDRAISTVVSRRREDGDAAAQDVDVELFEDMVKHCLEGIHAFESIKEAAEEALKELKEEQRQYAPAVGGHSDGSGGGSTPGADPAVGGDGGGVRAAVGGDGGGLQPAAGTPPPRPDTQQQSGTDPQHLPESSYTPAARVNLVGMCSSFFFFNYKVTSALHPTQTPTSLPSPPPRHLGNRGAPPC